jgi:rhomboid family GlyGly-CTERM serine protease
LAGVFIAAQAFQPVAGAWQFERQAWTQGAWWQLFSAQWVHLDWFHLALNAAACVIGVPWLARRVPGLTVGIAYLGGLAGVAAVLWADATCAYYAGASGALHGVVVGSAVAVLCRPHGLRTRWAGGLLVLVAAKLGLQAMGADAHDLAGFPIYQPAHWAGALGGGLAVALWCAVRAKP